MGIEKLQNGSEAENPGEWVHLSSSRYMVSGAELALDVQRHPDGRYLIRASRKKPGMRPEGMSAIASDAHSAVEAIMPAGNCR